MSRLIPSVVSTALAVLLMSTVPVAAYDNFTVAVYCRAHEVREMADPAWLEARWREISSQVHIDKVYLETHRDGVMPDAAVIEKAKAFFAARGVQTAGGITYTIDESNRFETFSFSNPEHRKRVQEIAEFTARHFDELILDDFFFTSTKSEYDIRAKGDRTWTAYRLDGHLRRGTGRRSGEENESACEGRDQVPQLVRALPGAGFQSRATAGDL
jgi:hypothetical protein